jgi:hypothetical protein
VWPPTRVRVYLELGLMYHQELKDPAKALENFKLALAATPQAQLGSVITQIPQPYLSQLVQISSSKK